MTNSGTTVSGETFTKDDSYYQGVRTDLIALAPDIHGRVLEIGCGEGPTMEYLRSRHGCTVVGLDYCESAIVKAREKGFQVHACDLNSEELPFQVEEFDYILIGDVLEHLYDPWGALKKIVRHLKADGTILVSIPNIKHFSILMGMILADSWEYRESGLLDSTHIRFFTLRSVKQLMASSGLDIREMGYNLSHFKGLLGHNFRFLDKVRTFFAVHYLVAATKRHG